MRSLYGGVVLSNCCISGPERYFVYYDQNLRYIFKLLDLVNQTSSVGNKRCSYFNDERK